MSDGKSNVANTGSASQLNASTDDKLDDIYQNSSEGINDVKQDATGENVRADIGKASEENPLS